jgi:hypothetical protein
VRELVLPCSDFLDCPTADFIYGIAITSIMPKNISE